MMDASGTGGTGTWMIVSGTATITDINSPTTTVDVPAGTTVTLKWTVSNGVCPDAMDEVVLTHNLSPTAAAGDDQALCSPATFQMDASSANGIGMWTVIAGAATIATPNSPTTTVDVPIGTSATLKWTVSNDDCPAAMDEVVLTHNASPTVAVAGDDQSLCEPTVFNISGNVPTVGTGKWVRVSGPGTITDPNSPATTVTGFPGTTFKLKWVISTGTCPDSEDELVLVNLANPNVTIAIDEDSETPDDGTICAGDNATLIASGGTTYLWETNSTLSDINSATPIVNPLETTDYTVTVTNANNCSTTVTTTINVTFKTLNIVDDLNRDLDVVDPCSCDDPLNKVIERKTFFHDVLTVTSTPGRSIWVSIADFDFRDRNNNILPFGTLPTSDPGGNAGGTGTGTLIPETATPGVYQLDFYHFSGRATNITVTDGTAFENFTSSLCISCESIPTMNQWGLLIFGLLILNFSVFLLGKKERLFE